MPSTLPQDLHSAAYFGDQRDYWWNPDYLALVARRHAFEAVRTVLDAGCGVGHWSRALLPHLPHASLVGLDREPRWAEEATARAGPWAGRARYEAGDVNALPFPDGSFDLVTCQTLLIHVPDVAAVLREFRRVLKPGGLLLVAEPNNLANGMAAGSVRHADGIEERLALVRLQFTCERGKVALGEGDNSAGEIIPGLVAGLGFREVAVSLSDRGPTLLPPYETPAMRALVADLVEQFEKGAYLWSRAETERYFLAGGGEAAAFDPLWRQAAAAMGRDVEALRAGTFSAAGGNVMYVISGRKG